MKKGISAQVLKDLLPVTGEGDELDEPVACLTEYDSFLRGGKVAISNY